MTVNFDIKTGIHYGVISMHSITQVWCEEAQPVYGPMYCPDCNGELTEPTEEQADNADHCEDIFSADYYCKKCNLVYDASDVMPDEPAAYELKTADIEAQSCLDSDVMITKSPYYTYTRPCSPCCPNAGDLNNPTEKQYGIPTYCFPHDYFEDEEAPYPVYMCGINGELPKTGETILNPFLALQKPGD